MSMSILYAAVLRDRMGAHDATDCAVMLEQAN